MADYQLNRSYYEELCINKNKPEMHCHGKCQMKEKSQKENTSLNLERFSVEFLQMGNTILSAHFPDFFPSEHNKIPVLKLGQLPQIIFTVPNPPPVF